MEERKSGLVLIDTCVFLKYFLGEEDLEAARRMLLNAVSGEVRAIVSVCTISELVTICIRKRREHLIPSIMEFITQNFHVTNTETETAVLAGYFKARYSSAKNNLSYVDSVILATAFLYGSTLLTYDQEFRDVKEVQVNTPEEYIGR